MPLTQTAERRIPAVEVLEPRARDSWTHTRNGDPRGYIDSDKTRNCGFIPAPPATWPARFAWKGHTPAMAAFRA